MEAQPEDIVIHDGMGGDQEPNMQQADVQELHRQEDHAEEANNILDERINLDEPDTTAENQHDSDVLLMVACLGAVTLSTWKIGDRINQFEALKTIPVSVGVSALALTASTTRVTPNPFGTAVCTGLLASCFAPCPNVSMRGALALSSTALAKYIPDALGVSHEVGSMIVVITGILGMVSSSVSDLIEPYMRPVMMGLWGIGNMFGMRFAHGGAGDVAIASILSGTVLHLIECT